MTMFERELSNAGHTTRFTITEAGLEGWDVRVEQDRHVIRNVRYTDWHRVERALSLMSRQVSELEERGWRDTHER